MGVDTEQEHRPEMYGYHPLPPTQAPHLPKPAAANLLQVAEMLAAQAQGSADV